MIAQTDNIVAINGALTIDLSGQVGVNTIGTYVQAGVGGHLAFALGAFLAPKGRYVCVPPSTAQGGTVSTILPEFPAGQIVTVPRDITDTVVTEYGIARLLGKTVRQRAQELIANRPSGLPPRTADGGAEALLPLTTRTIDRPH